MNSMHEKPFFNLWTAVILFLGLSLALFYQLELSEDAYQHWQNSVEIVQSNQWERAILDIWNKPIPLLLYGMMGQTGLFPARAISVFLVVGCGLLIWLMASTLLSDKLLLIPYSWAAIFLTQSAVGTQWFVTMTELPAAFILILGLWLFYAEKSATAFFVLGCLPLARVEGLWIAGVAFLGLLGLGWLDKRGQKNLLLQMLGWICLGLIPFTLWWAAGFWVSKDVLWLWRSAYVTLREWDLLAVLQVNYFNGLAGALNAPLLMLFFLGVLDTLRSNPRQHPHEPWWWLFLALLLAHAALLSTAVVYPKSSLWGAQAVAAINARNYNVLTPLLTLFIFRGALKLENWTKQPGFWKHRSWIWIFALVLSVLSCSGNLLQLAYFKATMIKLMATACSFLITGGLLWGWVEANLKGQQKSRKLKNWSQKLKFWPSLSVILVLSFVVQKPLFWYPTQAQDLNALAQEEFCLWFRHHAQGQKIRVLQDLNGNLPRFCGLLNIDTTWAWPGDYLQQIKETPVHGLIVLQIDEAQSFLAKYPAQLLTTLKDKNKFALLKKSQTKVNLPWWEGALQNFSQKNQAIFWIVYEKIAPLE